MNKRNAIIAAMLAIGSLSISSNAPAGGLLGRALNKAMSGKRDGGPPMVAVSTPASFSGVTQVVIGQFTVVYLNKNVNYGDNAVYSSASGVKTVGTLAGVEAATFQATTDAVFETFKTQMAAHGIAVVDSQAYVTNQYRIKAVPEAQGVSTRVQLPDAQHSEGTVYWPSQLGRRDNAFVITTAPGGMMMNSGVGASISWISAGEKDFAKTSGIPVMNVHLIVDFAEPLRTAGRFSGTEVQSGARIAISNYGTQVTLMRGTESAMSGGAKMVLQSPIVEIGNFASAGARETNGVGRAIGAMAGLNVMGQARFSFNVSDQNAYKTTVLGATSQATELFAGQMQSLR
jgi:hypothetical protein